LYFTLKHSVRVKWYIYLPDLFNLRDSVFIAQTSTSEKLPAVIVATSGAREFQRTGLKGFSH